MNAPFDITGVRLETDRLILRPWTKADVMDMYTYASVPGVGEMAGWNHHKSPEESEEILKIFIDGKKTFALELKETGRVIGSLGMEMLSPDPVDGEKYGREIGYVLSRDHWGKGLMPEAVQAVCAYCFRSLNFDYLTCGHFAENVQSARVIEKCGFQYFGTSKFETHCREVKDSRNYILYNPYKESEHV